MKMGGRETVALLKARAPGEGLWVRGLGASMAPVLRSGDSLYVRRCGSEDVAGGDLVLLLGAKDQLIAHLVVSAEPLRTAGILGRVDPEGLTVLGRVTQVRRGGRVVPLPPAARRPIRWAHGFIRALAQNPSARAVARAALDLAQSPSTAPVRRAWLGTPRVRRLEASDVEAMMLFCGDWLTLDAGFAKRQLEQRWSKGVGAAAGAFVRGGRLAGFAFLDDYRQEGAPLDGWWVRYLYVSPWARGMGLARALVTCLCEEGARQGLTLVHADVRSENTTSVGLFRALGFVPHPERAARLAQLRGEQPERWVWLDVDPSQVGR